jgi:hypothetical protein
MDRELAHILITCLHCGNRGLNIVVGTHIQEYGETTTDPDGDEVFLHIDETIIYHLLSCPVCKNVSLFQNYSIEPDVGIIETILYPSSTIELEGVPVHVKSAYESALKIQALDPVTCLLALRRTFEAICKDKEAEGDTLYDMTSDLIGKGVFPQTLGDACWVIRQAGNEAAHSISTLARAEEVKQIMGFLESIIDYTYSLPIRIKRMKVSILSRGKSKSSTTDVASTNTSSCMEVFSS